MYSKWPGLVPVWPTRFHRHYTGDQTTGTDCPPRSVATKFNLHRAADTGSTVAAGQCGMYFLATRNGGQSVPVA